MSPFPRGGPTIEGWKAKSKLASVCPVGTLEKRSEVLTRRSSGSVNSMPMSRLHASMHC